MNNHKELLSLKSKVGGKNDHYDDLCLDLDTGELFIKFEVSSNSSWRSESVTITSLKDAKKSHPKYFKECIEFIVNNNLTAKGT